MQMLFSFTPILSFVGIFAMIGVIRKRIELYQWWIELCDEAECTSSAAQLYQALKQHEHQLLLEHLDADTVNKLSHHTSPTLSALARDLQDYLNPKARMQAVQQALERRQRRRSHEQENLAH